MARRPDLEGQQVSHTSGSPFVYIVIDGILRWIPNPDVWRSLFGNWNVATEDISGIDGFSNVSPPSPLPVTCRVVRGNQMPQVFLIDYLDPTNLSDPSGSRSHAFDLVKRWIQNPAAMAAYGFKWPSGNFELGLPEVLDTSHFSTSGGFASTVVPQIVIDAINTSNPLPLGGGISGFPF